VTSWPNFSSRWTSCRVNRSGSSLVNEQGEPLLADFGLALRGDDERQTVKGEGLGTPGYMAPEQWRGEAVPASDQYSLGCLLFELLTGQLPFAGRDDPHHMFLHLNEPAPPPRRFHAEVPLDLETICLKCLEKEPARRYATCQELADDLRRWLEGEPILTRRVGPLERLARWGRKNPLVVGLLAAVIVLLTAGVTVSSLLAFRADRALKREQDERSRRALAQVDSLLTASPPAVPELLKGLAERQEDVLPRLREVWEQPDNPASRPLRMRAALALLPEEPDRVRDPLVNWMLEVPDPAELLVIREALQPHADELREPLWQQLKQPGAKQATRLRLLAALAGFDPTAGAWKEAGDQALAAWLADNPLYLGVWAEALLGPLTEVYQGKRLPERRAVVASILAAYLSEDPDALADRLMDAEEAQFAPLFEVVQKRHREAAIPLLTKETKRGAGAKATEAEREALARRQANAGRSARQVRHDAPLAALDVTNGLDVEPRGVEEAAREASDRLRGVRVDVARANVVERRRDRNAPASALVLVRARPRFRPRGQRSGCGPRRWRAGGTNYRSLTRPRRRSRSRSRCW
jgi:hypothetical protein